MDYTTIIKQCNPSQSHWELNELLNIVSRIEPKKILEIGVHRGGSMRVWENVFDPSFLVGIDTEIHSDTEGLKVIKGYSHEVFDEVKNYLFDFIFIDGSHYYPDVKRDFETYSTLVRPGGIIGFHDVVLRDNDTCQVYKFWDEVKKDHKTITIWDGTPAGTGEGILWM